MPLMSCARCRLHAPLDDVEFLAEWGWRRLNVHDVTSTVGLAWVCAECWALFVREDQAREQEETKEVLS